jgi:hypothetical protein
MCGNLEERMYPKSLVAIVALIVVSLGVGCAANVTATPQIIVVTATSEPSVAPLPTATLPAPTQTPTATAVATTTPDVRVIDSDPRDLLVGRLDLPREGKYVLRYEKPRRNKEIVANWTVEKGEEYLAASGRIDGWEVLYVRTVKMQVPENIELEAVIYESPSGMDYTLNAWGGACDPERDDTGWNLLEENTIVGADYSNICYHRTMQPSGKYMADAWITMTYRNVIVDIWAWDWESNMDLDVLRTVAATEVAKLGEAPLSEVVSWRP